MIGREARNFARKTADLIRGQQIIQGEQVEEYWALKNVSFQVNRGQVLGIIGHNGAGKSTLLKILSRITEPSDGRVVLRGLVGSLLEVGTGFHPELTGRENIFLNGAILGMTRYEIQKKFDEIVAFAEVEKFLDTPVKRYSSGMYVRLAFAVAAHLEPESLWLTKFWRWGTPNFKVNAWARSTKSRDAKGRTVLFVSHNMGALASLCPLAIWLDHGSIRQQGETRSVINGYLSHGTPNQDQFIRLGELPRRHFDGENRLRLQSIEWLCSLPLRHGEPVKARIHFKVQSPIVELALGIGFSNLDGRRALTFASDFQNCVRPNVAGPGVIQSKSKWIRCIWRQTCII